jgi:hypothetical protein
MTSANEIKTALKSRKIKHADFIRDTDGLFSESHLSHLLSGRRELDKATIIMFRLYIELYDLKNAGQSHD